MIIDNVRIIPRDRTPPGINLTASFNPESYHLMLSKREHDPCLVFDVTIQKGDSKPLVCESFIHDFMSKNFPEIGYHLERCGDAFNSMLNKLEEQDSNSLIQTNNGKAFVYYYCYSTDQEAMDKLARFVSSKVFLNKVEKALQDNLKPNLEQHKGEE